MQLHTRMNIMLEYYLWWLCLNYYWHYVKIMILCNWLAVVSVIYFGNLHITAVMLPDFRHKYVANELCSTIKSITCSHDYVISMKNYIWIYELESIWTDKITFLHMEAVMKSLPMKSPFITWRQLKHSFTWRQLRDPSLWRVPLTWR